MLPDLVNITSAKEHDRYGLKQLVFPKQTIVVEDRAYFDFELIAQRITAENIFVTRIKSNTVYEDIDEIELPDDKDQDILIDQIIHLKSNKARGKGLDKIPLRSSNRVYPK